MNIELLKRELGEEIQHRNYDSLVYKLWVFGIYSGITFLIV